jgi:hypothetical protein
MRKVPSERLELLKQAACVGANPRFFDGITWEDAEIGLEICKLCKVKQACEREVLTSRPRRSHYDGVAGGRVWRDGQLVKRPKQWKTPLWRGVCGTKSGITAHLEREELLCLPCRVYKSEEIIKKNKK